MLDSRTDAQEHFLLLFLPLFDTTLDISLRGSIAEQIEQAMNHDNFALAEAFFSSAPFPDRTRLQSAKGIADSFYAPALQKLLNQIK